MTFVLYEMQDHVAVITLNRPDRMNALGRELATELRDAETRFAEDDDAWVGVYTGAGDRAFCAGRDLKEVASSAAGGDAPMMPRFDRIAPDIGKPTIAAVNGAAYGGGMERALACDIRLCSENATFALAEVKVGLCPRRECSPFHASWVSRTQCGCCWAANRSTLKRRCVWVLSRRSFPSPN